VFDWNAVITNIAALTITGVSVYDHAPQFTQDCKVPALYPSFSPTVDLNSVERLSACVHGQAFKRAKYTLNYVYLHIETTQGVDNSKYETAIRGAMSNIFAAIALHDTDLGVYEVIPTGFSIAEKLIEVGGRTYLGGQLTFEATEFINQ
jgi:hypothetical protein